MVWHGLVDEVTGYVDDVRTFMVDLDRLKKKKTFSNSRDN